jgi:hypothetical protein
MDRRLLTSFYSQGIRNKCVAIDGRIFLYPCQFSPKLYETSRLTQFICVDASLILIDPYIGFEFKDSLPPNEDRNQPSHEQQYLRE